MPERRAHEPVPVARKHVSLTEPTLCRNGELTSPFRRHENTRHVHVQDIVLTCRSQGQ